ncbi:hypothetical protein EYF80_054840 [Liparis tanakae]|uniref:Uncharacterized protein n=1 Tax=Liparis tanakae TaxID=230148 RepID=A0A4Z2F1J1_9TELE|nr:hypothetical protein EYF80_054840 [Liparis tanakae]
MATRALETGAGLEEGPALQRPTPAELCIHGGVGSKVAMRGPLMSCWEKRLRTSGGGAEDMGIRINRSTSEMEGRDRQRRSNNDTRHNARHGNLAR